MTLRQPPQQPRDAEGDGPETVSVTVNTLDAAVLVLGPLEYAVRVSKGELPRDGSPMRVRQALAKALRDAGVAL